MGIERVGIMTGGGDCPGLNAVIRAVAKVAMHRHGWKVLGIEDAFEGLIDLDYRSPYGNRWLDASMVREILPRGGTILGTSNHADPFRYAVEREGRVVEEDVSDRVLRNFESLGLDALVSIGGDGSMRIAQKLADRGMPIVGVPKTIDNDLSATDYTFGFDTALHIATDALDRIRDTAESHDRVMLVEVMGRDAGWIAMHAGLSGGAHAILLPEIPYRVEPLREMIRRRKGLGRPFSVIVVAEGARPAGGEASAEEAAPGAMRRLKGAAARVADQLAELGCQDLRITVLGHLQRGGSPSPFDRVLATRLGHHAVELVARGDFGKMVALRTPDIVAVPLSDAVGQPNLLSPDHQLVKTARALGVVFGDES